MTLLFATTNPSKLREVQPLVAGLGVDFRTLAEVGPVPEPDETGTTFWENARIKALGYAAVTGLTVVAEDSGLDIAALGGDPGVQSARFLGPQTSYPERFAEIFRRLGSLRRDARRARFVTALSLVSGRRVLFETESWIEGEIADLPAGEHGFGYDPIFYYPPLGKTTAQLTLEEKTAVSHRARAFRDLARWLRHSQLP
jgi:XTP/dITP diphosphohydrolase